MICRVEEKQICKSLISFFLFLIELPLTDTIAPNDASTFSPRAVCACVAVRRGSTTLTSTGMFHGGVRGTREGDKV
jgi:hypothetical protein